MDYMEERFDKLYVPGQNLSLDETLIRAFGRIKFKVRIISKAARYGIKLYVITCALTAFVLKVIIYTGRTTYTNEREPEEMGKTVKIVKNLSEKYAGSFRTVYVDRFYTSIDLLKQMDRMKLFVTGTCMKNRLPKELIVAKSSREFKQIDRGQHMRHKYTYVKEDGTITNYGLVCWKDRDMVYCLSSCCPTDEVGECHRRSTEGIIKIQRPKIVGEYNKYMGGVDLADQRRLHSNSTLMGQHRWWLKLFFYLLDVGTSNALVLYNSTLQNEGSK